MCYIDSVNHGFNCGPISPRFFSGFFIFYPRQLRTVTHRLNLCILSLWIIPRFRKVRQFIGGFFVLINHNLRGVYEVSTRLNLVGIITFFKDQRFRNAEFPVCCLLFQWQ